EINSKINTCGQCGRYIKFCSDGVCCIKCGKPILGYNDKQLCYFCINNGAKRFDKIVSVFAYEDLVRNSIIRFKAKGYRGYADTFSDCMAAKFFEEYSHIKFDFLCGVPSNDKRNHKKDFDPVELLCNKLSKKIDLKYEKNIFKYLRKIQKQSALGYKERQKNMIDSLEVFENVDVSGKTILLIDDICTTRATITECSRALKKAGAKHVFALTLATVKNPD
ncbi:MAG: ComF family protein, partial [Clostridia bacterium]|nr:ComF family protein [Clostridia bacterium]